MIRSYSIIITLSGPGPISLGRARDDICRTPNSLVTATQTTRQPSPSEPFVRRLARVLAVGALVMAGAPSCSRGKADMSERERTNIATLRKFVTLQPVPVDARWSISTIGDGFLGPSDTRLWAVVRYSDADFTTISHALTSDESQGPVTLDTAPAWLLADPDIAQLRRGTDYVVQGPVSTAKPFASNMYNSGFALVLPGHRVLIHFSSM